jgi:hypothetical protein
MATIPGDEQEKLVRQLRSSLWESKIFWISLIVLAAPLYLAIHLVVLNAIFDISPYTYKAGATRSFIVLVVGIPIVIFDIWVYRTFWDELMIFRWINKDEKSKLGDKEDS